MACVNFSARELELDNLQHLFADRPKYQVGSLTGAMCGSCSQLTPNCMSLLLVISHFLHVAESLVILWTTLLAESAVTVVSCG